ncbi:MAG: mono/diheme cytochrome c family protein [Paracoccaceae bacterium]
MKRFFRTLFLLLVIGAGAGWYLTSPKTTDPAELDGMTGDPQSGHFIFLAGGCSSCHAADKATGDDKLVLSGGKEFVSPFGTFFAPNISNDPQHGIGNWTDLQLVNAMKHGVSPEGQHYFPAFPYTSYTNVPVDEIVDLRAYMATLPASSVPSQDHLVSFPFNIRRSLGGWKLLFMKQGPITAASSEQTIRGRQLVEGLVHCSECHTPRNFLGGTKYRSWLTGAPNPSGKGTIPNISAAHLGWTADEIVEYLTSGFTPEFDSAGGEMVSVIQNISQLPQSDREAIAAYLLTIGSR